MRARPVGPGAIAAALALLLPPGAAHATPLSDLAAAMEPGTFEELAFAPGVVGEALATCGDSGSNIGEYADSASWDPGSHQVLFLGNSHGTCYGSKFIIYREDLHEWRVGPLPAEGCLDAEGRGCVAHSYSHNTIDPETGIVYYRFYGSRNVWQFDTRGTGTWTLHSVIDTRRDATGCCDGLEFFPAPGRRGLLFVDGSEGVYFWSEASGAWSLIANTGLAWDDALPTLPMGGYENFAEHDPVHDVILFGGGDTPATLYTYTASGEIATETRAPDGVGTSSTGGWVTVDPVSGRFLVFQADGSFYEYDAVAGTWAMQPTTHPLAPRGGFEGFEAPIATYGVNLFVVWEFASTHVWLYKHQPSTPPPPWDAGPPAADGGGTGSDGGGTGMDGGGSRLDSGAGMGMDGGGCGCRVSPRTSHGWLAAIGVLAWALGRRRRLR